nr:MAG TPA: hypothetical protein [Caudoviricetes sp.]
MVFLAMVSFIIAIGVSIMLIWAAGVINSMKLGQERWVTIVLNIVSVVVALVGIFGILYSTKVFTTLLYYLTMVEG